MENVGDNNSPERESTMKISKSKRVFSLLIATTFALFGLLVLCPVSVFADTLSFYITAENVSGASTYVCYMNGAGATLSSSDSSFHYATYQFNLPLNTVLSTRCLAFSNVSRYYTSCFLDGVALSTDSSNPTHISFSSTFNLSFSGSLSSSTLFYFVVDDFTPSPTPTLTPTPTPTPSPTPDPAEWLNNYIFNQTSEDMWVGVEDINSDDVTYDVIPAWSYKNFYFKRNTTYRITARTEQDNVYYSLQYYTDLYNYVPLEYSLSSEGWYTYTELPYTSINISTGSDTNTSGIYTFVRFRHDLPTLPPVTPVPGMTFTPDPSSSPTEAPYITPVPGNPTLIPDNSTPTPVPDISGEAVAGFNKLTNIFNGIFDAAYQSVNAANGNFWTSFFFIGLPVFLVILGLIAWIIFGSSDDD